MNRDDLAVTGAGREFTGKLSLYESRRLDRLSQMFVVAGREAAAQAGFAEVPESDRGVVAGTGLGCVGTTEALLDGLARNGIAHADPMSFADSMGNAPAAHVAIACGARGVCVTAMEREISGESAVVLAARLIRSGQAAAILVVAGDTVSPAVTAAFARLAPGITPGEGAGALVIESAESARRRGARVLARLRGWASETAVPKSGSLRPAPREAVDRARDRALAMAGFRLDEVLVVPPDPVRDRTGWFMADGLARAVAALATLETSGRRGAVIAKGARGACAAALVFGRAALDP